MTILFYILAGLTLGSALAVVLQRNAVNAAMCLLLSLVGVAGLFVLLDAYLLAALLILVYAGAVVALFLFIVMLLDVRGDVQRPWKAATIVSSLLAGGLLLGGVVMLAERGHLASGAFPDAGGAPTGTILKHYAEMLFTVYLLPVQVMGFLLLIAMLGVIVLSKKHAGLEDIK